MKGWGRTTVAVAGGVMLAAACTSAATTDQADTARPRPLPAAVAVAAGANAAPEPMEVALERASKITHAIAAHRAVDAPKNTQRPTPALAPAAPADAGTAPGASERPGRPTRGTVVRGGYVNDAGCVPVDVAPTDDPDVFSITCTGGSIWNGDFTGHTIVHVDGTIDTAGRMHATYEEILIGTYVGDHSHGGLRTAGIVEVSETSAFMARADIIGGTCDWAGSAGSMSFDGFSLNGGYVGDWVRPATPPASDPTCNPADGLPGFE